VSELPPGDPLACALSDYGAAVLHLAWDLHRKTKARTLLCGAVELVPSEIPPPLERPERPFEVSHEHKVYCTSRVLSVAKGLGWFDAATEGSVIRPAPDESIPAIADGSPTFEHSLRDVEPARPGVVTSTGLVPFSPDWHFCPRVRHLIARDDAVAGLWTSAEFEQAREWLTEETNFPWKDFPEYWGAVHLIAPNPVFRSLAARVERSYGLALLVTLDPRSGQSLDGLDFEFESRRATGIAYVVRKAFEGPTLRVDLPDEPAEMFERVHDARRGLLYASGPSYLNKGFTVKVTTSSETRRLRVPARGGEGPQTVDVPLQGSFSNTAHVGEPPRNEDVLTRLWQGRADRDCRNAGVESRKWFREREGDATEELRKLVGAVTEPLLLVDPYFGGDDLFVLLAVRNPAISIEIMVGAEHLRRRHRTLAGFEADHLEARLVEAQKAGPMNPIAISVMEGSEPAIHDRLLFIGTALWMLGSSLNAFGSRGTMLVRVPDPKPILDDVRAVGTSCRDFSSWLAKRRGGGAQ
jgi:hypothetical protein